MMTKEHPMIRMLLLICFFGLIEIAIVLQIFGVNEN